jgi:hypothetical protein
MLVLVSFCGSVGGCRGFQSVDKIRLPVFLPPFLLCGSLKLVTFRVYTKAFSLSRSRQTRFNYSLQSVCDAKTRFKHRLLMGIDCWSYSELPVDDETLVSSFALQTRKGFQ